MRAVPLLLFIGACGGDAKVLPEDPAEIPSWLELGPLQTCVTPAEGPSFLDVGRDWGLGGIHDPEGPHAGGAGLAVADLDADGDLDVALAYPHAPAQVFWREGDAYVPGPTLASGEAGASGFGMGDLDGDGDLDVGVTGGNIRFAWNQNEGGAFTDATASVFGAPRPGLSAPVVADRDRDGDLDVILPARMPFDATRGDLAFDNDGAGRLTDVTATVMPVSQGAMTFQGLFFDADGDLFPEYYGVNDQGSTRGGNAYLHNEGGTAFTNAGEACSCAPVSAGMSGTAGDVDGDGSFDLFLGNSDACNLFLNDGSGRFHDAAAAAGVREAVREGDADMVWGSLLLDHDNDGDLDILAVHGDLFSPQEPRDALPLPDALLSQQPDGTFRDVAPELGLDASDSGRSIVADDWNGDGLLDVLVTVIDAWPHLYLSQGCTAQHWLEVDLDGPALNRFGIGARVEVVAGGKRFVASPTHGSGLNAARRATLHLGLGEAPAVEALRVYWPDGSTSATDVAFAADRKIRVVWGG